MTRFRIESSQTEAEHDFEFVFGERTVTSSQLLVVVLAGILLVIPSLLGEFYLDLLTRSLVLAIFAISVNLIWGYGGVLTFGHAFFFGLSGYIMAKLLTMAGFAGAGYVAVVVGVVVTGLLGLAIGGVLFYRNISGAFFAIITLAIAVIGSQVATAWRSVTGGYNGITALPAVHIGVPGVAMYSVYGGVGFYAVSIVCLAFVLWFTRRLIQSPFGKTLAAIRENEEKARSLGYQTKKYKTIAFGISAAMAGFAGGVFVAFSHFVGPSLIGFLLSTEVLFWVLIGGRATLLGPILGTIFTRVMEDTVSGALPFSWVLVVGAIFVVLVLVIPEGLVGAIKQQLYPRISGDDDGEFGRILGGD